ncbi:hypothetical protein SPH9361_04634 [Sphingobium sp. CECT 9361]|nr:hypothetical protein SPH9361_04634 [Sphingobium sp. CECT 9361]
MAYFLRIDHNGKALGIWEITTTEAVRIDVTNPRTGPGSYFRAETGEEIFEAIRRQATSWFAPNGENPFHCMDLGPGEHYPRMARPNDQHPYESPGFNPTTHLEQETVLQIRSQTTLLARRLSEIFQTIHPTARNMQAYGNDIRNLLILAAMEVEAQWKGILRANGKTGEKTSDYVALLPAMKLDQYRVTLPEFPWLTAVAPFRTWDAGAPSKSLEWYNAYNATKHDREVAFGEATLERAIAAVCANVVLLAAQYGIPYGLGQRSRLADDFYICETPRWEPSEVYIDPYSSVESWKSVPFPF